jgi:hypothetical protein
VKVRGPEKFYSVCFKDDYGFYPVDDLFEYQDWPTARCLEFVMGYRPVSFTVITGYGIYIEHEDFWVFGKTPEEVRAVAYEWPEDDVAESPR